MNKLLQLILVILIISTPAFAFSNAINEVFGEATNYFDFEGSFGSGNNIAISKVTRNDEVYGNRETFSLVIPGRKTVTNGNTTTTYNITLSNTGSQSDHLFNFNDINYPVVLKLDGITAPRECKLIFNNCKGLIELDLSSFDTSNVTSMHSMFYYCTNLAKINLANLNTSSVTSMFRMFSECRPLTKLDLTDLDTSKVTNMGKMFENSKGLRLLRVKSNFPANPTSNKDLIFNQVSNLMILSSDGTFDSGFESFVKENYSEKVGLFLEIEAGKTLTCTRNTYTLFNNKSGILFGNNSVLKNGVGINCSTDTNQPFYFELADGATSATIENFLVPQHDGSFNETDNVYRVIPAKITGNYSLVGWNRSETTDISMINGNEVYLEDLTELTGNDTVSFAIHEGEFLDQNTVVIKNESDEPAEIAANISNNIDKDGYTATDVELQGSLKFSGDQSGFVNGKATASGADIEFVGDKSMFQVPLELTNNSKVKISEFLNHERDITVDKGSQLEIKENVTFSGGTFRFGW